MEHGSKFVEQINKAKELAEDIEYEEVVAMKVNKQAKKVKEEEGDYMNMKDKFITPEGRFLLAYSKDDGLLCTKIPYSAEKKSIYEIRICGDLMTGKEFYEDVDCGGIIDYDGILGNVFVDGFESNLGLTHRGLSQGDFMVDGNTWLRLCDEFDIMVEWCNK